VFRKIRGYSLKEVEENIQRFLMIRSRKLKPKLKIRMTINSLNYTEILEIYNKWKYLVDEIMFQAIHEDKDVFFNKIAGQINTETIKKQFEELAKIDKYYDNEHYQKMYLFFQEKNKLKNNFKGCHSFYYFIDIDPFGNFYNCGGHKINLGNIRSMNLNKIINSNKIQKINELNKECFCYYDCAMLNRFLGKF
jgi:hypothetical protein